MNRIEFSLSGQTPTERRLANALVDSGRASIGREMRLYYDPFERSSRKVRKPVGTPCYPFFEHVSRMLLNGAIVPTSPDVLMAGVTK